MGSASNSVKISGMKNYFDNLESIQRFTMELDRHCDSLECKNCKKSGQFVSHGFTYKKDHNGKKLITGKRIFCSNRNSRSGCGSTFMIYLKDTIPTCSYMTTHVLIFLNKLIAGCSIRKAYNIATNTEDARNAYRWLHKLYRMLSDYRVFLNKRTEMLSSPFRQRVIRLQHLLPTIQCLFLKMSIPTCAQYQILQQKQFI